MDNSTQTSYFNTVQKNFQLQKSKTQKILNSVNKKPVRLIDSKGIKNLSHLDSVPTTKPLISTPKAIELYKSKKIKINIHTVLFPYKKLEDEILHKTPVNLQISQRQKNRYDIHSLFKKTDEPKKESNAVNPPAAPVFPLLSPRHKRNHTVSNFADIKKNPVSVKSLLGNYMTNVNQPKLAHKRSLLRKVTNMSQEVNLLHKLQNERLKELIFK
jgi:hypothetical protein